MRADCLTEALELEAGPDVHGIRGGLRADERRRLASRQPERSLQVAVTVRASGRVARLHRGYVVAL